MSSRSTSMNRVSIRETHWGFMVSDALQRLDQAEFLMKLLGVMVVLATGALLVFGAAESLVIFWARVVLFFVVLVLAMATYMYADRGLRPALQVDPVRKEFRLGTINRKGLFTLREQFPIADIESVFLVRARNSTSMARLHLRPKGSRGIVFVMQASEGELTPVLERIVTAVQVQDQRRKSRRMTTRRVVQVDFS